MHIPPQNVEIEQLYSQIVRNDYHAVVMSSASEGEGVTSIAMALAHRALLGGHKTLLVDFNLSHPSLHELIDFNAQANDNNPFGIPQLVTTSNQSITLLGIPVPTGRNLIMKLRKPGTIETYIEQWRKIFDFIIFDTSSINQNSPDNIPAERVISACDGTFLVVLAGETNEAMLSTAVRKIDHAEGKILGSVFNDMDNPTLKSELLRETKRLNPKFRFFSKRIRNWINSSRLLSTEI